MTPQELLARLRAVRAIDLTAITRATGQDASVAFARKQFATGGRYGGKPWAGYTGEPAYAAYKRAAIGHLEPLKWDGAPGGLEDALTNPRSRLRRWSVRQGRVQLDIAIPYLRRLETGGVGPFGERFPARVIFPDDRAQLSRAAAKIAGKKLINEVKRTGLEVRR